MCTISESTPASAGCGTVVHLYLFKNQVIYSGVKGTDKQTMEELSVEVGIKEGLSNVSPG